MSYQNYHTWIVKYGEHMWRWLELSWLQYGLCEIARPRMGICPRKIGGIQPSSTYQQQRKQLCLEIVEIGHVYIQLYTYIRV